MTQSTSDVVGLVNSVAHVYQEFAYDAMSRRTEAKASYGASLGATKDYWNTYVYNAAGQLDYLTQKGQSGGNTVGEKYVDYTYDYAGDISLITRYKALAGGSSNEGIETQFGLDALGRYVYIQHMDDTTSRASYQWSYDAMGRIRSVNMTGLTEDVQTYSYDASGQLTVADRTVGTTNDESYSYDLNGNRTMSGYTTGDDNRITSDGTYNYYYDSEGNMTERRTLVGGNPTGATTFYSYDHRNRLTSVTEKTAPTGGSTTKIVSYDYDAFDRRVSKILNSNGTGAVERFEFYVWDDDEVVFDFVDSDGGASPSASLDKRYLWGQAVDEILAEEAVGGSTRWHLADHLGTVRDLADGDGNLISGSHVDFNSFGKIVSGTPATRFTYTGQEYDPDTGLYYYNARWYNAAIGRFISRDPIGFEAGDTNQYRYVGNNAANSVDPSGLLEEASYPEPGGYGGGGWNPLNWYRWMYTGDPNCPDMYYDAAMDDTGEYVDKEGLPEAKERLEWVDEIDPTPLTGTVTGSLDALSGHEEEGLKRIGQAAMGPLGDAAKKGKKAQHALGAAEEAAEQVKKKLVRGGENAAAKRGRQAHKEFAEKVKAKGWQSEPKIDLGNGKYVKPDALTPSGRPIELKPNTPSGKAQGAKQLKKYEQATGKKGKVIYYDP